MDSYNKICRSCLSTKEYFTYELCKNVSPDVYFFCTSIEIIQSDTLPKTICDMCYDNLTKYSEFKKICLQSHDTLFHIQPSDINAHHIQPSDINAHHASIEINDDVVKTENETKIYTGNYKNTLYNVKDETLLEPYDSGDSFASKNEQVITYEFTTRIKTRKLNKMGKRKKSHVKSKLITKKKLFGFSCDLCNRKFKYQERFDAHKLEHEGKIMTIHCRLCKKIFKTWSGLQRHNENEHTVISLEKLKCKTCERVCKNQQTLRNHQAIHKERKLCVCDICGKDFTTKNALKIHIETHKDNREKTFTCELCRKKFYTNAMLHSHVLKRHTGRRFICQICNYPFTDKYNLAKHLMKHEGKKLYKCGICTKVFSTNASLVEHGRIHSGERPFVCLYCSKCFLSKRRLNDHHKIHTGERPHKCTICKQSFTQRGTLNRHMKVHEKPLPIIG